MRKKIGQDVPDSTVRDQMLVALTDKATMLKLVEVTHGSSSWSSSANSSSVRELQEGIDLIDAERARLDERVKLERLRRERMGASVEIAASDAVIERLMCRLGEIADHREHLTNLIGRVRPEVEVESIEWQRPLALADGEVVGFVDLWATLRVTSYRVTQGNDPNDHEQRMRYEGYSVHHLIRSVGLFVEPSVRSLTDLVRRVRYAQAYAKNLLPVLVTCTPTASELLAGQGIPTYQWSAAGTALVALDSASVMSRRIKRVTSVRRAPAQPAPLAQLPSPRPSLPPAPLA